MRDGAFDRAERWIAEVGRSGVAPEPTMRTFQNRDLPPRYEDARVDIEIRKGTAFVCENIE